MNKTLDENDCISRAEIRKLLFSYYDCVNENTTKENYKGETLMAYEVADMIEDCCENAKAVVPERMKGHERMNKDLDIELDLLKGNINRMCVTDSKDELITMYTWANIRLTEIYEVSRKRIIDKEAHELKKSKWRDFLESRNKFLENLESEVNNE